MMRVRFKWIASSVLVVSALVWLVAAPISGARGPSGQQDPPPEVFAEAVGQANLRSGPGLDYPVVGQISSGTRYRVLAQHALVPWLEIDYPPAPTGRAWVYKDLVSVAGRLGQVPFVNDFDQVETDQSMSTPTPTPASAGLPAPTGTPTLAPPTPIPPTLTPTPAGAFAVPQGDANVRFGPGLEYPTIEEVPAGSRYRVLAFHALVPWVQIELPDSPTGTGWIFQDIVEITGDVSDVPYTNTSTFNIPDLTPTPQTVVVSGAPWNNAPVAPGTLASTLGEAMHAYLLKQGFSPYGDQIASVFVMNLQTGDTFTLNDNVAYSGMSLTKIPILVTYFQRHSGPLSEDEAFLIGDTMMCSENLTTNSLLEQIGDGDMLRGAQRVTALMQTLNLRGTYLMRQYAVTEEEENTVTTDTSVITTGADQTSTNPDPYNQILPKDLGWLLAGIYQCAEDGSGLLTQNYPDDFTPQECRQMLAAMDANQIGVFTEAGVPDGTRVIHKHGWINDTHGDAALVIGPKGAYVFVAVLYGEDWLAFDLSSPTIAELSRMAWNTFNPETPLDAIHPQTVPAQCDPREDPVMGALLSSSLPAPSP